MREPLLLIPEGITLFGRNWGGPNSRAEGYLIMAGWPIAVWYAWCN